jgi:SnoaL-like domain
LTSVQATTETSTWLHDVEELKQHKARYGCLVDLCMTEGNDAAQRLSMLFTEDAELDFRQIFGKALHGRKDVYDHFGTALPADRAWTWHAFSNPIIEIEGDRAKVRWLLYAMSTPRSEPEASPKISYGHYDDEYVRTKDGWLQSGMVFTNETRKLA